MVDRAKLNGMYNDEGWGELATTALGLEPVDVESQARTVARYAADRIEELEEEVEVLRLYGNKSCTAMADEELERRRSDSERGGKNG